MTLLLYWTRWAEQLFCKDFTWRSDAAKASWELLRRVLNWEQMLLASLAALRLSMASWATFRFHSGVMAGGFTNVILWIIYSENKTKRVRTPLQN